MQNELKIEDSTGFIISIYHGHQTAVSILEIAQAAAQTIQSVRAQHKPVLLLIDTRDIESQDSGSRKAAIEAINSLDYDKMAIYGAPLFIKYVVEFLITVSQKKEKIKYFDTEEQARSWLMNP
jgi:predicted glycosyltransferase